MRDMPKDYALDSLRGEEIDFAVKPHPLSFLKYHAISTYLIITAFFLGWVHFYLKTNAQSIGFLNAFGAVLGLQAEDIALLLLFWSVLLLSGFAIGVLWITRMPLFYMVLVGIAGTVLELYSPDPYVFVLFYRPMIKLWLLGIAAIVGMILTEIYRRGHLYTITNYRVIIRKQFLTLSERELMYDKIADVHVEQGVVGRILNFGTVNPITTSGLGLGEDSASASTFAAMPLKKGSLGLRFRGRKSVQTPRAATYLSLYGIRDPRRIRVIIGNRMLETKEAPILRNIKEKLSETEEKPYRNDRENVSLEK